MKIASSSALVRHFFSLSFLLAIVTAAIIPSSRADDFGTPNPSPTTMPVESATPSPEPTPVASPDPTISPTPVFSPVPTLLPSPGPTNSCPDISDEPTPEELDELSNLSLYFGPLDTSPTPEATNAPNADEEVYKYEGPTTDFTGVPLIYEKVYKNDVCIKTKKFYYCGPCSDINDDHPSIWVDPATAKFLFEPPYAIGGQRTLGEVNYLAIEMGTGGRFKTDLDPDLTNGNFPLQPSAQQRQTVVTSHVFGELIRSFTLIAP